MPETRLDNSLAAMPGTQVKLGDGEVLYHQGEDVDVVYSVVSGYVKFTRVNVLGNSSITAILGRGELFGGGLAAGQQAVNTAAAKCDLIVHRYSRTVFLQFLGEYPLFAAEVIAMLSGRQELQERRLQAILHMDVRSRIGMVLNDLTRHYGGRCGHGHEVDIPLTQQELAELAGASRPVVSSRLNELRRQGVLDYSRGFICVDNLGALSELAKKTL